MEDSAETDVLIVGGGLSGLSLARALRRQQEATGASALRFQLVEARPTLGGRIHSVPDENADGNSSDSGDDAVYDMGPAWFWPGQRRIATLLKELDLNRFDQFAKGAIVVQVGPPSLADCIAPFPCDTWACVTRTSCNAYRRALQAMFKFTTRASAPCTARIALRAA
jgi:monoamine oxidase